MNIRIFSVLLILLSLISCDKEEDAAVFKAPINFLQPSTDPANIVKGALIKYDIRFVNDEYIDSVMVYYQIDSIGTGYNSSLKDSMVDKMVYIGTARKNEQSLAKSFLPHTFPAIGKKIYLKAEMRSKTRNQEKILPLIVN
jgi:uncharacterized lipoprotein NlpE involved in copper resistance